MIGNFRKVDEEKWIKLVLRGVKIDLPDDGNEFTYYITDELADCITE